MRYSINIGIDTHAKKNVVCAIDTDTGELYRAKLDSDPALLIEWIGKQGFKGKVRCVYETGPTGFVLARALNDAGIKCSVAAVSKLARRHDRMKNDERDAEWLSRELIAGGTVSVKIPTEEEESLRDLSRLRGTASKNLAKQKQRVASFLLGHQISYTLTQERWTVTFRAWAAKLIFDNPTDQFVFDEGIWEVYRLEERLKRIDDEIKMTVSKNKELAQTVTRLKCLRGIGNVTAFALIAEIYDFTRFKKPSALSAYLGLIPAQASSGQRVSSGSITKCGNSHLRRLLIEAAASYAKRIGVKKREEGTEPDIYAFAHKCANRLTRRRKKLISRKKQPNKIKVALARELAEQIYCIALL